jgi:SAM-dependent methyltransferase
MSPETITRLNALNRRFYQITAAPFDATRQRPWAGWARLLPHLPETRPLRVLDVGCGNGRFGVYLREHAEIRYHGVDNNAALLDYAREALPGGAFEQRDVVQNPPDAGTYDVVALFGVIHHVPGGANRRAFMRALSERVAPGGILAFAAWRFMENARLRGKIVDWFPDLEREDGDYLLDWRRGETAVRYCHYVDDAEHAALVAATGLQQVAFYRADGHDRQTNAYSVLRRGT